MGLDTHPWDVHSMAPDPGKASPEFRLWVNVMVRALADLCSKDLRIAEEARRWFLVDNEMFGFVCSVLGLDRGNVRRVARDLYDARPRRGIVINFAEASGVQQVRALIVSHQRRAS